MRYRLRNRFISDFESKLMALYSKLHEGVTDDERREFLVLCRERIPPEERQVAMMMKDHPELAGFVRTTNRIMVRETVYRSVEIVDTEQVYAIPVAFGSRSAVILHVAPSDDSRFAKLYEKLLMEHYTPEPVRQARTTVDYYVRSALAAATTMETLVEVWPEMRATAEQGAADLLQGLAPKTRVKPSDELMKYIAATRREQEQAIESLDPFIT